MPKIEYVARSFKPESLELIEKVNAVIEDYQAQGYDLTLRQVYYQMVARTFIPNNEHSYKNLGSLINDARLAGLIDWKAIEDRTRNLKTNSHWTTPRDIIHASAWSYHLDHWQGQENYVEVWVEKDALAGIVGKVCEELDVPWFSCRGYVSQSEMWGAAQRLIVREQRDQHVILLHLGDHDPSGRDMSRDIQARLDLFGVTDLEFHRLALNMDQIKRYAPPPNPTKVTDSRSPDYIAEFGYECWELDALEPRVITNLIQKHVNGYLADREVFMDVLDRESQEKQMLRELSTNWGKIAGRWKEIKERYCSEEGGD